MKRIRHHMAFQYSSFQLPFQFVPKIEIKWQITNWDFDFYNHGFKFIKYTKLCAPKFDSKICTSISYVGTKQNISVTIKKNNGVLPRAKKHFWTIMDVGIFKATNNWNNL